MAQHLRISLAQAEQASSSLELGSQNLAWVLLAAKVGSLVGRGEHEPAAVLGAGHGGAVLDGERHEPEPFFTPNPDTPKPQAVKTP